MRGTERPLRSALSPRLPGVSGLFGLLAGLGLSELWRCFLDLSLRIIDQLFKFILLLPGHHHGFSNYLNWFWLRGWDWGQNWLR